MSIFVAFVGAYLMWYSARISVFNYESEEIVTKGTSMDKTIYWGAIPVFVIGAVVLAIAFKMP